MNSTLLGNNSGLSISPKLILLLHAVSQVPSLITTPAAGACQARLVVPYESNSRKPHGCLYGAVSGIRCIASLVKHAVCVNGLLPRMFLHMHITMDTLDLTWSVVEIPGDVD